MKLQLCEIILLIKPSPSQMLLTKVIVVELVGGNIIFSQPGRLTWKNYHLGLISDRTFLSYQNSRLSQNYIMTEMKS